MDASKCPTCKSKKVDIKESYNRFLYIVMYSLILMIVGWIGIRLNGTPVVFLFLGLLAAFVLFLIRLVLERRKTVTYTCLDCGHRWQSVQNGSGSNK
jgi:hypothetical protein